MIYLYLERFQENVLDRTAFFGSRKGRSRQSGREHPEPSHVQGDMAGGD